MYMRKNPGNSKNEEFEAFEKVILLVYKRFLFFFLNMLFMLFTKTLSKKFYNGLLDEK